MLPIAEKIRTLRKERGITQDEIAAALRVSFQSVSRWENGQTYPDIELIPKIAAYFGVTTDELLVEKDESVLREERERRISRYHTDIRAEKDSTGKFELAMKAFREFPDEYWFASDALRALTHGNAKPREEALPVVRELANILLNQTKDRLFHNRALYSIFCYEDEDRLPDWHKYVGEYLTLSELTERRYSYLDDYERLNHQCQDNLFRKLNDMFPLHACKHYADEEETARSIIEGSEISLRLFDQFRDPAEDIDLFLRHRAWTYLFLAKGHFRLGNREEGYAALEKSVDLCEMLLSLPTDTILRCPSPLFDLLAENPFAAKEPYLSMAENAHTVFLSALTGNEGQWRWLEPYREEERYRACVERLRRYYPDRWIVTD